MTLQRNTGYKVLDLKESIYAIHDLLLSIRYPDQTVMRDKYQHENVRSMNFVLALLSACYYILLILFGLNILELGCVSRMDPPREILALYLEDHDPGFQNRPNRSGFHGFRQNWSDSVFDKNQN
jgi:hypothetical protein